MCEKMTYKNGNDNDKNEDDDDDDVDLNVDVRANVNDVVDGVICEGSRSSYR